MTDLDERMKQREAMLAAPPGPNAAVIQANADRWTHIESEGQPLHMVAEYCAILAKQMIYLDDRPAREKKFAKFNTEMARLVAALTPKASPEKGKEGQDE